MGGDTFREKIHGPITNLALKSSEELRCAMLDGRIKYFVVLTLWGYLFSGAVPLIWATNKYYRNVTGDWDTDANWSLSSGGPTNTTYPVRGDAVIFDANSGSCTPDANVSCDNMSLTGYANVLDAGGYAVTIHSNITMANGTLNLGSGTWTVKGNVDLTGGTFNAGTATMIMTGAGKTLTSNGRRFYHLAFPLAGASVTLQDAILVTNLTIDSGYRAAVGSYTGNGNDNRPITGVGFRPDVVIIKAWDIPEPAGVLRTSAMPGDNSAFFSATADAADLVQSLDADGFTIGTKSNVNQNGAAYYWQAMKASQTPGLAVGSYTGNGTDNRSITGVGFRPDVVLLKAANTADQVWKPASLAGDASLIGSGIGVAVNHIQAFEADGFQIGTDARVNATGVTYWYLAWYETDGLIDQGTYTGNGVDNRSITGAGFQPDMVWIQESAWPIYHRTSQVAGDSTMSFLGSWARADCIQAFEADGMQIGSDPRVNENGWNYYYLAWKATTNTATTLNLNGQTTDVDGNVTMNSQGILTAGASTINVAGNWTNNGIFTANVSTVTFDDSSKTSTISGSTAFYNLTCATPRKRMHFTAGTTQTVTQTLTLIGASNDWITLRSSATGFPWKINTTGASTDIRWVDVQDSTATVVIRARYSIDSGSNINWRFIVPGTIVTFH